MIVGFVGSGSMAAAMARGWAGEFEGMLFSDSGSGRAAELALEVGGEAVGSNGELAERADIVVLAVKPAKLDEVAAELGAARNVVSAARARRRWRESLRLCRMPMCFRVMPNVGVEVRRGVLCVAGDGVARGAGDARGPGARG